MDIIPLCPRGQVWKRLPCIRFLWLWLCIAGWVVPPRRVTYVGEVTWYICVGYEVVTVQVPGQPIKDSVCRVWVCWYGPKMEPLWHLPWLTHLRVQLPVQLPLHLCSASPSLHWLFCLVCLPVKMKALRPFKRWEPLTHWWSHIQEHLNL
jgi:hypothetical protein